MRLRDPDIIHQDNERERRHRIWDAFAQVYREFASESTVHGIKYTTQARTSLERFIWLLVVGLSVVCATLLANKFYMKHKLASMRTTIVSNQYPSAKLAIPAVTLCEGNLVSRERLALFLNGKKRLYIPKELTILDFERGVEYLREMIYPSDYVFSLEMEKLQRILDANYMGLPELLEHLSPQCAELLISCSFEGENKSCMELFVPTLTPYGLCCSFNYIGPKMRPRKNSKIKRKKENMHQDERDDVDDELYSAQFGSSYIISMLLRPYNASDHLSSTTFGDGYRLIIHERYSLPGPNSLEFLLQTGYESVLGLSGTFLFSSPEILEKSRDQRGCRISRSGNIYRSENCYIECQCSEIFHYCGCMPFYAEELNRALVNECNLTHVPCLANIFSEISSLSLSDSRCGCLPDCEATRYTAALTGGPLDAAKFKSGQFFKKAAELPGSSAVHITFASQAAVLQRRELALSWINLVCE
ncbi:hypothetical protein QAD02_000864 [Eretmocerus hayati]|uniref:Uncharacterized protein n=1 Tax=Eretmocerus hayati TaxID=131215 RepID=A0ACC2NEL6_9HYME|nr:hypothetical protein QAD02_000864 [Eretmocerus hayati]